MELRPPSSATRSPTVATEQALSNTAVRRGEGRAPGPPRTRRPSCSAAGVAGAILAIAALALRSALRSRRAPATAGEPSGRPARSRFPSIAVLPLTNYSGEPEYFVDGMTDALISSLARMRGVRVISRQSAMHYKGSTKLLPEIARELGVDYVVEGSVARDADNIRLNAQVIQADPETTLWVTASSARRPTSSPSRTASRRRSPAPSTRRSPPPR